MTAYILRRLVLMIPTLLGIMLVTFAIVQFAPGGPVERMIAKASGFEAAATQTVSGGMEMGLEAMIRDLVRRTESARAETTRSAKPSADESIEIAAQISAIEAGRYDDSRLAALRKEWQVKTGKIPVVGITGTGGAADGGQVESAGTQKGGKYDPAEAPHRDQSDSWTTVPCRRTASS